jgi:hypothetical protein
LLAFLAGFSGMALEAALLLQFQTRSGVLYQDLGFLLTLFMAGLAAGAAGFEAIVRRHGAGRGRGRPGEGVRIWGSAAIGGLGLLGLASAVLLRLGGSGGLLATAALLFACGALVAAVFASAALRGEPAQQGIVGPVYAADLAGGCIGSLVAGLAVIPMLGLAATATLAAVLALAGWIEI